MEARGALTANLHCTDGGGPHPTPAPSSSYSMMEEGLLLSPELPSRGRAPGHVEGGRQHRQGTCVCVWYAE